MCAIVIFASSIAVEIVLGLDGKMYAMMISVSFRVIENFFGAGRKNVCKDG